MSRRVEPYTTAGIKRCKCFRCGAPAHAQWQVCADRNTYRPICIECDLQLNALVLKFMGFLPSVRRQMMTSYRKRFERGEMP